MGYSIEYWNELKELAKKFNWAESPEDSNHMGIKCGKFKSGRVWLNAGFNTDDIEKPNIFVSFDFETDKITDHLKNKIETYILKKIPKEDGSKYIAPKENQKRKRFIVTKSINIDMSNISFNDLSPKDAEKMVQWHKHILNILDEAYRKMI